MYCIHPISMSCRSRSVKPSKKLSQRAKPAAQAAGRTGGIAGGEAAGSTSRIASNHHGGISGTRCSIRQTACAKTDRHAGRGCSIGIVRWPDYAGICTKRGFEIEYGTVAEAKSCRTRWTRRRQRRTCTGRLARRTQCRGYRNLLRETAARL